jgi:serine/threonine protein kinase
MLTKDENFAHFLIAEKVGRGGMGVVFRAIDTQTNQPVALKLLAPYYHADNNTRYRFQREANVVAQLHHPNIAEFVSHGEVADQLYIALEWVEGQTLKQYMAENGNLAVPDALSILQKIGDALDYTHKMGVVHRDIKPSNILVTTKKDVKIVDFGLGRMAEQTLMTASDAMLGTPHYMSPEQFQGNNIDGRADQYAVAIVLYEMLTGQRPFSTKDSSGALHQQLYELPIPITKIVPTVPVAIEQALLVALEKKPERRFPTITDFVAACRGEIKISKRMPPPPKNYSKQVALTLLATMVLLTLILSWQWWSFSVQSEATGTVPTVTPDASGYPTPVGATPCNLLADPSFALGVVPRDYFETAGVKSLAQNTPIDGTTALRIGGVNEYGTYGQAQLAVPGHEYTFAGTFQGDGELGDANIGVGFLNIGNGILSNVEKTIFPTERMVESVTLVAPPETYLVYFWAYKDLASGTLLVDNLVLRDNDDCLDS